MATTEDAIGTRSLRKELETFIKDVLSREDTITGEKLAGMAHEHFDDDVWMREALIREGLNALLPQIAGRVRHQLRLHARECDRSERDAPRTDQFNFRARRQRRHQEHLHDAAGRPPLRRA